MNNKEKSVLLILIFLFTIILAINSKNMYNKEYQIDNNPYEEERSTTTTTTTTSASTTTTTTTTMTTTTTTSTTKYVENIEGYDIFLRYKSRSKDIVYYINSNNNKCFEIERTLGHRTGMTLSLYSSNCEFTGNIKTNFTINGINFKNEEDGIYNYYDGYKGDKHIITSYDNAKKIYNEYLEKNK